MASLKRRKFKRKDGSVVRRVRIIEELEYSYLGQSTHLTDTAFKKALFEIFIFQISNEVREQVTLAVRLKIEAFLDELTNEIQSYGHGALHVDLGQLRNLTEKYYASVRDSFEGLLADPNLFYLGNSNFRQTFNRIVQTSARRTKSKKGKLLPRSLRRSVKMHLYMNLEDIRRLFEIRFEKPRDATRNFQDFVKEYLLSDVALSNFLRDGKSKKPIDYKEFDDARRRFFNQQKRKSASKKRQ